MRAMPRRRHPTAVALAARTATGLSQLAFADKYRIPVGTIRNWEQQLREPDSASLTYLLLIEYAPERVAKLVRDLPPV